jgi:hypothetical protein
MGSHKRKISLTKNQLNKLRLAHKRLKRAVLTLTRDQLKNGNVEVLLDSDQNKQIEKAIKSNRGLRLILDHSQLKEMIDGGLLKEVLELAENNIPYFKKIASPLIKTKVAPVLKNQFVPWLKKLIDDELDTLMEKDESGAGLIKRIHNKLNKTLNDAREIKKNNN